MLVGLVGGVDFLSEIAHRKASFYLRECSRMCESVVLTFLCNCLGCDQDLLC